MKTRRIILGLFLIVLAMLFVLPKQALAAPSGKLVLGGTYTLQSGETLYEDLVVLGGYVRLEADSVVNGDVAIMGGTLFAAGIINGDLITAGGAIYLQDSATVKGDFTSLGAQVERNQGAEILGEIFSEQDVPVSILPDTWQSTRIMPYGIHSSFSLGWFILRIVLWGLLAMLIVMFLPDHAERVTKAVRSQPLIATGLGIATVLILPILLVILAITICLLPVSLIGFLGLVVAWAFGVIALGLEVGRRFGRILNQNWQPALAAGVGTFLLALALDGFNAIVPCLGWLPQFLAGALGLGAVMLTRFGTQEYSSDQPATEIVEPPSVP